MKHQLKIPNYMHLERLDGELYMTFEDLEGVKKFVNRLSTVISPNEETNIITLYNQGFEDISKTPAIYIENSYWRGVHIIRNGKVFPLADFSDDDFTLEDVKKYLRKLAAFNKNLVEIENCNLFVDPSAVEDINIFDTKDLPNKKFDGIYLVTLEVQGITLDTLAFETDKEAFDYRRELQRKLNKTL